MHAPTFDTFATAYETLLSRSVRWSGEGADYFVRYKLARIQAVVGASPPAHILDIGCGVGLLTAWLSRAFPASRVTGLDLSSHSVAEASARCAMLPNVRCEVFRGDRLTVSLGDVDVAILANVLHHIAPDDRPRFLRDVVQPALRPGARVIIFEHNPFNPLTRLVVRACPFDRDARLLTRRATVTLLRHAGLQVLQDEYIVFFPKILHALRRFEPSMGRVPLGAQYLVVGRWAGRADP